MLLDADLTLLYAVETRALNQAVRRNEERSPQRLMFRLTVEEEESLRSQIVTSNEGRDGCRYLLHAFTEQGTAMLSAVMKSKRAIEVNIAMMKTYVRPRQILATQEEMARQFSQASLSTYRLSSVKR